MSHCDVQCWPSSLVPSSLLLVVFAELLVVLRAVPDLPALGLFIARWVVVAV